MFKRDWTKLQDFQNENKDLLIMIACPREDGISISFGGLNTFVKFPMETMDKGVVFNALRSSQFENAIEPFMEGIVKATGITTKDKGGNELLKTLGGAVKSIGIAKSEENRSRLQIVNKKNQHGKRKR